MPWSELFRGEAALVTGAASGIGFGIARRLAACGARVVLSDVAAARGEAAAAALRGEGWQAGFVAADLAVAEAHAGLLRDAEDVFGPLDMLVHSASPGRPNDRHTGVVGGAEWDAMLDTNLRSGFFLARDLGLAMAGAGRRGRMLFVASLHAGTPRNLPHYSAAKAGQAMVVKELARYFGPAGIRVNAIAPGAVPGGGFQADTGALTPRIPLRRLGTPEDMGRVAVALLSDEFTPYVTGALVPVDGGLALHNWIEAAAVEGAG